MNICIIADCEVKPKARGLCTSHYYKHKYAGTLESVALPHKRKSSPTHTLTDLDTDSKTATCIFCGPLTKIYQKPSGSWVCRTPRITADDRYNKSNGYRLNHSNYAYGDGKKIDKVEAKAARELFSSVQNDLCAICSRPESEVGTLHLDHCHTTGTLRGLLCCDCNLGLGRFRDSPELLLTASAYLVADR